MLLLSSPPKKTNLLWIFICIFEQIPWDYTPSSSPTSNPVNPLTRSNHNCEQGALCFKCGAGSGLPGRSEGALANQLNTGHPFPHNRTQPQLQGCWQNLSCRSAQYSSSHLRSTAALREATLNFCLKGCKRRKQKIALIVWGGGGWGFFFSFLSWLGPQIWLTDALGITEFQ